jgi:hypothetical protein
MKSFRSDEEVQQAVHEWVRSSQKFFFLEVSMHFRSAGTLVWNAMETTYKNEVIVLILFSINCEIKNIKCLRFPFDSPSYFPRGLHVGHPCKRK